MRSAAAALSLCCVLGGAARAADGSTLYRDTTWRFEMEIAKGWTTQPLDSLVRGTRFLIGASPPFNSREGCVIDVTEDARSKDTPQAELDRSVRDGEVFGPPDSVAAVVVDLDRAGELTKDEVVKLKGRSARLIEAASRMNGKSWTYILEFLVPGRVVKTSCRASDEDYSALKPVFLRMLHSLRVSP